ncbi:uncharacterized protein N7506_005622 [Penicillium brevicompactum]|uniref:uncharacterized protein n=1 Tax=Penicillium brevicompactum TaxID=5074 RepID=UPI002541D707|nr:uncharacterized protein N7506_005622 [Penicillium brevicompactum]KAJ5335686.1 hypothetical protein N7506_005622 [Penicillium brevicompactum]
MAPEHGKDTETFYLLQQEIRDERKLPDTDWTVRILWFKNYKIPWGEMARTRIGRKLLVEWGLQHPAFEVFSEMFPEDDLTVSDPSSPLP